MHNIYLTWNIDVLETTGKQQSIQEKQKKKEWKQLRMVES